jgi:uncharacterized protein
MKRYIAIATAAAALALPAAADAHVTLQPNTAAAGGFTRVNVRVPNERDDASTTKVELQLPDGFEFVSYEPVAGWSVKVTKQGDNVKEIRWASKTGIAPGQFRDFGLSVGVPGKAGDTLTFKALQTYSSGETVRWIGPEGSDNPAPTVSLTAASGEAHAAPAAAASSPDDGNDTLSVVALVVGALGLLAGVAAFASTRRRPARV